jgi:hypothetical protein
VIGPDYFSIKGNKEHRRDPLAYSVKTMENDVKKCSPAELNQRAASMVLHREKCVQMANNDIARYTRDMAKLLEMTVTICNEKVPVQNRDDWCHSLIENPSNEQTQKFIFAWLFIRQQYKTLTYSKKGPDELFEDRFLAENYLEYDLTKLGAMKKNTKTCVRRLYSQKVATWRDTLFLHLKTKRNLQLTLVAPSEIRKNKKRYRREPNTFYVGTIDVNKCWMYKEVSKITGCKWKIRIYMLNQLLFLFF